MIVKNEEDVLARCLKSAEEIADELIIVDTGSSDRTVEIAGQFTDKVFLFEWADDFSAARNFSFSKASMDYIMWLDADDIISERDARQIIDLKTSLDPHTGTVFMKYHTAFDENGEPAFSYYRERILKNCADAVWREPVHETIIPFGKTVYSDAAVTHKKLRENKPGRNLKIFEKYIDNGGTLSPRLQYYYGRELMYNSKPAKAARVFEKFLKGGNGWTENNISACRDLASCYKTLGEHGKAAEALLKSFTFGEPRAEAACGLALLFFEKGDYKTAAYWYKAALGSEPDVQSLGFVEKDYYGFIPAVQLAVIYDKLKDLKTAAQYNELAGTYKPLHPSYLSNKEYFAAALLPL
jgi:glycosyltransferase involved in cell wall biosynthesis